MKEKKVNIKTIVEYILGILLTIVILAGLYWFLRAHNFFGLLPNSDGDDGDIGEVVNNSPVINEALLGAYTWSKSYTNSRGDKVNLKINLVLKDDGTATYEAGDGSSNEITKGIYTIEDDKVIYTKMYYNYPNQKSKKYAGNNKTETFEIIDDNTLQNTFSGETTALKKTMQVTKEILVGTYTWSKSYTNSHGNKINLKITLILNDDGTATYEASDGYANEATKGTYTFEGNKVFYNREYYNYPNQENTRFEENNKVEVFEVIDKNTLQNTFNDNVTELVKQANVTDEMLVGVYKWSKTYTNSHGDKINLKVTLVLNDDGTAAYEASDGLAYEATKGTYTFESNKIIYTREYYNYPGQETTPFEEDNKIEIFEVLGKGILQNTFNDYNTELKKQSKVTKDMLVGTYSWSKTYTNSYGNKINLNVSLVLNSNGTATYEAGDGSAYEATKGTYKYENGKIIYTREYYNYSGQENTPFEESNKIEIFEVINGNTLQNTFNDQVTELKK